MEKKKYSSNKVSNKRKCKVETLVHVLKVLKENGVNIEKIKKTKYMLEKQRPSEIQDIEQPGVNIYRIIEENNLDPSYKIGKEIADAERLLEIETESITLKEQLEEFKELMKLEKKHKLQQMHEVKPEFIKRLIDTLEVLQNNGVDILAIPQSKDSNGKSVTTRLRDINQPGIAMLDIAKENNLDIDYPIGSVIRCALQTVQGKGECKVPEEYIDRLIQFKLITREETEAAKEQKKETATKRLIRVLTILEENEVDVYYIDRQKKVDGEKFYTTIRDIEQEGINIDKIIEDNGLDPEYKIGSAITNILNRAQGEDKERLQKFNFATLTLTGAKKDRMLARRRATRGETAAEKLIKVLTILDENGVDVGSIKRTKYVDGIQQSTELREIKQKGIDIDRIIEENNLDPNLLIGRKIMSAIQGVNGTTQYNVSEEQVEKLIGFGLITRQRIEYMKELRKAKEQRDEAEKKNREVKDLENKAKKRYGKRGRENAG